MRLIVLVAAISCCYAISPARSFGEHRITLLNEIDAETGHDNHIVAVQLFSDRAEITYCHGTDTAYLLPLIRTLQGETDHAVSIKRVHCHQFDIDTGNWVIVGICNRMRNADAGIYVWASDDVARSTAKSFGASFKEMRRLPVEYRPRTELAEFFTPRTEQ